MNKIGLLTYCKDNYGSVLQCYSTINYLSKNGYRCDYVVEKEYDYVERKLKEVFGTKVKVANKKIEINFSNNNDLDRILDIMNIKFD